MLLNIYQDEMDNLYSATLMTIVITYKFSNRLSYSSTNVRFTQASRFSSTESYVVHSSFGKISLRIDRYRAREMRYCRSSATSFGSLRSASVSSGESFRVSSAIRPDTSSYISFHADQQNVSL